MKTCEFDCPNFSKKKINLICPAFSGDSKEKALEWCKQVLSGREVERVGNSPLFMERSVGSISIGKDAIKAIERELDDWESDDFMGGRFIK